MPDTKPANDDRQAPLFVGPRAILRVPELLIAVASVPGGSPFAHLRDRLDLPKSSLHRLLRTLEQAGYLVQQGGLYALGPASATLARELGGALSASDFPRSARPVLEWLARETRESVILAELTADRNEVFYVDVVNSEMPLRVWVPSGNKRPLYAAASGQAILAFLSAEEQQRYFARTAFEQLTGETLGAEPLKARLPEIVENAVVFDRNGSFAGASAVASPCFDGTGRVRCAVALAGPTERIEQGRDRLSRLCLEGGRRVSRILGFAGPYPPRPA